MLTINDKETFRILWQVFYRARGKFLEERSFNLAQNASSDSIFPEFGTTYLVYQLIHAPPTIFPFFSNADNHNESI